jgi:hypothetical protein
MARKRENRGSDFIVGSIFSLTGRMRAKELEVYGLRDKNILVVRTYILSLLFSWVKPYISAT